MNPRVIEILGQVVVGDGVTCLIVPRRHMLLWRDSLPWTWWRTMVQWFADNPWSTMLIGVAELIGGTWLIVRASRDR